MIVFLQKILTITNGLTLVLESEKINWTVANAEVNNCIALLQKIDDSDILKMTEEFAEQNSLNLRTEFEFRQDRQNKEYTIELFTKRLVTSSITMLTDEFQGKFSPETTGILSCMCTLDPNSASYLSFEAMQPLLMHYKNTTVFDVELLEIELQRAEMMIKLGGSFDYTFYPNLSKVSQLFQAISVTSVEPERSFSKMRDTISLKRNSIAPELASHMMVMSMNKALTKQVNLDKVLMSWSCEKSRMSTY